MADPAGESDGGVLRLGFDLSLMLRSRGAAITSDAGLLAHRELDDALGPTAAAGAALADARTGKNGRHALAGLLRQSVFGRLAGYEDVNDAGRLRRDPAMRRVAGDRAVREAAASDSQMGRFQTEWLTRPENLAALADLPGLRIDTVHGRRPPREARDPAAGQPGAAGEHRLPAPAPGRPPAARVRRFQASFRHRAGSWTEPRRAVAKVEWHPGELLPRAGSMVTNPTRPAESVVAFYNHRGTAEQWIKEGEAAVRWTRSSCRSFAAAGAVRLRPHALAHNLGTFPRTLALPEGVERWSLTTLRERPVKIGAKVVSHGRYVTFQMREAAVPRRLFAEGLWLIGRLRAPPVPA